MQTRRDIVTCLERGCGAQRFVLRARDGRRELYCVRGHFAGPMEALRGSETSLDMRRVVEEKEACCA